MAVSDSVLNTLITTIGTVITTVAVVVSRRNTKRQVREVHDAVNEGRREAIIRDVGVAPDMTFPADLLPPDQRKRDKKP